MEPEYSLMMKPHLGGRLRVICCLTAGKRWNMISLLNADDEYIIRKWPMRLIQEKRPIVWRFKHQLVAPGLPVMDGVNCARKHAKNTSIYESCGF